MVLVAIGATQEVLVVGEPALNGSAPFWSEWAIKKPLGRSSVDARQPAP